MQLFVLKTRSNQVVLLNSSLAAARGNLDIDVDRRFLEQDNQRYQGHHLNRQGSVAPAIALYQSDLDAGGTMRLHARVNDHPGGMIPSIVEIDSSNLQSSRLLSIKGAINTTESLNNSIAVALTGRSSFSSDHQIRILGLFHSGGSGTK